MLAGEPPFTGPTAQAIVAKVMTERPAPLTRLRDTVPPHVDAPCSTRAGQAAGRPVRTAQEFADALAHPSATAETV